MLIAPDEASWFLLLYGNLIGYGGARLGGVSGIVDLPSFLSASVDAKIEARDRLLENPSLIDAFVDQNPCQLSREDLSLVAEWKNNVRGRFLIERDLKKHTIFLQESEPHKAYGVLGLTTEIVKMAPLSPPVLTSAVLLPWRGRIICDGLVAFTPMAFGSGLRGLFREQYNAARSQGIITSLDPDWRPPRPSARVPKSLAIERFLKKCPQTVAQLERRYGEPYADLKADAAREYSVWRVDGAPALDIDRLLIYPNIIRNQVLYVYARSRQITHVAVVDPTAWDKSAFRPHSGRLVQGPRSMDERALDEMMGSAE